jgi:hypothetical protein
LIAVYATAVSQPRKGQRYRSQEKDKPMLHNFRSLGPVGRFVVAGLFLLLLLAGFLALYLL